MTRPRLGFASLFLFSDQSAASSSANVGDRRGGAGRAAVSRSKRFALRALAVSLLVVGIALPSLATTWTVTDTSDSLTDTGSLRYAVNSAQNGDSINFNLTYPATITLDCNDAGYGPLVIGTNVTISGPGAANLAISGSSACTVFNVNLGVTATILGMTIENAWNDGATNNGDGGGIYNGGTLTVLNSTLSGNSGLGGGVYNANVAVIVNSTLSGNDGFHNGGGAFNAGTMTILNSTLAGNYTTFSQPVPQGGGIYNNGNLTVVNSTLVGNSAGTFATVAGAGIANDGGTLTLKSSLFAGEAQGANCANNGGTVTSDGYNLDDDGTCGLSANGDQSDVTTAATYLGPLQPNGGPTSTIALLTGSTAIDAIPVNECTDASGNLVATDQRGVSRPQGKGCDIGAFEVAVPAPTANVCTAGSPAPCSATITLDYYIPSGTTLSSSTPVNVVTQGTPGLDFTLASSTCNSSVTAASCTVTVTFAPLAPGVRLGAVELNVSSGPPIPAAPVYGIGVGPALAFTPGIINTVAGGGSGCGGATDSVGDGCAATSASLDNPSGTALDSAGNLYIADTFNHRVRKVDTSGNITTVAGTGTAGYNGDNMPASTAQLNEPAAVAVDGAGNLYIADSFNDRVRKVDTSGNITTVAGTGTGGYNGDNIPASTAQLSQPTGLALGGVGNLYIADFAGERVRKVDIGGTITTVAGNGTPGYIDNVAATNAEFSNPNGVALDSAGNLYIADSYNCLIREVTAATGIITTVAGTTTGAGNSSNCGSSGDGGPATSAALSSPYGVAVDSAGNIYIADFDNQRIRKVNGAGTINTVAGTGAGGSGGDGGPATSAGFFAPVGVTVDPAGNLYIADEGNGRIRAVNVTSSALSFPGTTTVGDTSSPLSLVVSNVGNANLDAAASTFVFPTNFESGTVSDPCSTTLAVGYDCNLGVEFAPTTSGNPLTGTLTAGATSNAYDASRVMVSLSGVSQAGTVSVTITSSPAGLTFSSSGTGCAPGASYTTPQILTWTPGSSCTVAFASPQAGTAGTQYVFSQWEDNSTNASRSITAPSSTATYTATFATQYLLTTSVSPAGAGTVTAGGYYAPTTVVSLTATPAAGYVFSGWTASPVTVANPSSASTTVTMGAAAENVTANFVPVLPALGIVPPSLAFGNVNLGSSESLKLTVTNTTASSFKITNITFNYGPGAGKDFGYTTQCGGTIKPGKTCTITVTMKAQDVGAANASLIIVYNLPGSPATVALTGTVINPKAKVNKSSLSFGNVKVNQNSTLSVILTSTGSTALTSNSITVSGSPAFTNSACASPLAPDATCTISVTFKPTAKKSYSGTLQISDNASSSPQTVSLSGKGD